LVFYVIYVGKGRKGFFLSDFFMERDVFFVCRLEFVVVEVKFEFLDRKGGLFGRLIVLFLVVAGIEKVFLFVV